MVGAAMTHERFHTEIDPKIAACRQATIDYRAAHRRASDLRDQLAALGVCATCAVGEHRLCRDYGCTCCGAGK
jgi:hypothetical protein